MGVVGLMNIQYAIYKDTVYILEANPRASRTVPLVSKVCNIPMARLATQVMLGKKLSELNLEHKTIPHFGGQGSGLSVQYVPRGRSAAGGRRCGARARFWGWPIRSTWRSTRRRKRPSNGCPRRWAVLLTVADRDKPGALDVARRFAELGFKIKTTKGTHDYLASNGIESDVLLKMREGRPNIGDAITDGEIQLVINTPRGKASKADDSYIRKAAINRKVPLRHHVGRGRGSRQGNRRLPQEPRPGQEPAGLPRRHQVGPFEGLVSPFAPRKQRFPRHFRG